MQLIAARTGVWLIPVAVLICTAMSAFFALFIWLRLNAPLLSPMGYLLFEPDPFVVVGWPGGSILAHWGSGPVRMFGVGMTTLVVASLLSIRGANRLTSTSLAVGLGWGILILVDLTGDFLLSSMAHAFGYSPWEVSLVLLLEATITCALAGVLFLWLRRTVTRA
jgi:hypothetical protein